MHISPPCVEYGAHCDNTEENKANQRDLMAATGLVISNWIQIIDFSARVILQFEGWPKKQQGTGSVLRQALWIISNPSMNSNWSYSPETLNSDWNWGYFVLCDLEIWWMTLKTIWYLFYITSSCVHHFKSIGEIKLEFQSGNAQFGSKSAFFCPVWPWNVTDDLEKQ